MFPYRLQLCEVSCSGTKWPLHLIVTISQENASLSPPLFSGESFVELGGWLPGTRRVRKPYNSLNDAEMAELRRKTEEIMPEFLAYKP